VALPASTSRLILRPIKPARTRGQWVAASGSLLAAAAFSFRFHGLALLVVWVAGLGLAAGMLLWMRSRVRHLQLALRGNTLYSGTPREQPVFDVGEGGQVVELTTNFGNGPRLSLCLVDTTGHAKVLLYAASWNQDELYDLWHRLGVGLTKRDGVYSPGKFADEFPGLLSGWQTRPGLVGSLGAIALIAVLSSILMALGWHPQH
jgi:hypothetical protein